MINYRDRKALIKDLRKLTSSTVYIEMLERSIGLNEALLCIFIFKEYIGGEYDYINIRYDDKKKILYGKPCIIKMNKKQRGENLGLLFTVGEPELKKVDISAQKLHEWFDGLGDGCFINRSFKRLTIPTFIKDCEPDSFKGCVCEKNITIPTHLIYKLCRTNIKVGNDCKINLVGTGDYGVQFKTSTYPIVIPDLLKKGENLLVYKDKLELDGNLFIDGFRYKKFYNNVNEFIICLLLAKYGVFCNSDVTAAVLDLYDDFHNDNID